MALRKEVWSNLVNQILALVCDSKIRKQTSVPELVNVTYRVAVVPGTEGTDY